MNISTWSIRHPAQPIALFLVLLVAGLFSFSRLPVTQFPNIDLPLVSVSIGQPGAAPSELITQIIQPVEDSIASLTGVRHITSTATDSNAQIMVEFELEVDSDRAVNDVKDAVSRVRADLPESITEPLIARIDVSGMAIVTYAVSDRSRSIEELSKFVDDVIARELSGIPAVAQVTRIGGSEREITVDLDPDRLLALGLTAAEVSSQLRQSNADMGGGRGDLAGTEYSIRTLGGADSVAELAAMPIRIADGRIVRLDQLGTVTDGPSDERSFALLDGQPVVAFGVFRASGKSDLEAAEGAADRLAALGQKYPGVEISLIDDSTIFTRQNFDRAMDTLYEGAALAVIVVFLFLRSWRATLIAAVALPLAIIPTFFVMSMLGFSLNTISLLGITLVTGILVDDAIVEIENIERHIHMGRPAYEASMEAATEIGTTVIAISLSIVAVFAPVGAMGGIPGQYFMQFGLTVAVSVLFSLLVARTLTPMLAAYFLRDGTQVRQARDSLWLRGLMRLSSWTLRHRVLTMLMGLIVFAASIWSATLLPTEFVPEGDHGRSQVTIELPPGATIDETEDAARMITARIRQVPEVRSVFVDGGSDGVTKARLAINYGDRAERDRSQFALEREIRGLLADVPDMRIDFQNESGQNDFSVNVLGDSEESATLAARRLEEAMADMPTLEGVTSSASLRRPEIRVVPRFDEAARLGVTATALANTMRVATLGDIESNLAKFNTGTEQIPILVRLNRAARDNLMSVRDLRVPSSAGQIPLEAVARISLSSGATEISRYDRRFRTSVSANLAPGQLLGPVSAEVDALKTRIDLPEGTEVQPSGDAEIMSEVFSAFATAMGAGVLLVYVVLVVLFHSFTIPISIILSLPLAIGGAILALYASGYAVSLAVVIGFLMLMGIVTKNAIMLVEFAIEGIGRGMERREAILDAVHKRARPIIMTTIAMTAGMVPSTLPGSAGAEFRAPMAIAVIGGLLLSTLLSMLFVPALFSLVDQAQTAAGGWLRRRLGINRSSPAEAAGPSTSAHE